MVNSMLKRLSVESILVMLLFILFTASIGILIVQGRDSYEAIIESKNADENLRIAYSYIGKRIKQNDIAGNIEVKTNPYNEFGSVHILLSGLDEGYEIVIFCDDNKLIEVYQEVGDTMDISLGEVITEIAKPIGIDYDMSYNLIRLKVEGEEDVTFKILDGKVNDIEK